MPCLPSRFAAVIIAFAPLFLQRSWRHAEVLLTGAILAPGRCTVTSILRISGLARERRDTAAEHERSACAVSLSLRGVVSCQPKTASDV
jgi:hypothetical protein